MVSILPRLATGIDEESIGLTYDNVSILPRLATGIKSNYFSVIERQFLFFPVLRRGSKQLRR